MIHPYERATPQATNIYFFITVNGLHDLCVYDKRKCTTLEGSGTYGPLPLVSLVTAGAIQAPLWALTNIKYIYSHKVSSLYLHFAEFGHFGDPVNISDRGGGTEAEAVAGTIFVKVLII